MPEGRDGEGRRQRGAPGKEARYPGSRKQPGLNDLAGRETRTLVKAFRSAGSYQVAWDRTDNTGAEVRGGVYFYRLQVGEQTFARKLTVVK